jgi:hypothetical protein
MHRGENVGYTVVRRRCSDHPLRWAARASYAAVRDRIPQLTGETRKHCSTAHGIVRFGPSNAAVPPRTTGLGTRGIRYSVRCDRSSSHCCDSVAIEGAPARDELVAHRTQLIVGRERCFNLHAPMCCAS